MENDRRVALPLAGIGAGGEARAPVGVAVAGGLLATTFLTIVVVPIEQSLHSQEDKR